MPHTKLTSEVIQHSIEFALLSNLSDIFLATDFGDSKVFRGFFFF